MNEHAQSLPIDAALPELTGVLRARNAAVLVAPPGAGKTTRVPLVLAGEAWAAGRKILVLAPRRAPPPARRARRRRAHGGDVERGGRHDRRLPRSFRLQSLAGDTDRSRDRGHIHPARPARSRLPGA